MGKLFGAIGMTILFCALGSTPGCGGGGGGGAPGGATASGGRTGGAGGDGGSVGIGGAGGGSTTGTGGSNDTGTGGVTATGGMTATGGRAGTGGAAGGPAVTWHCAETAGSQCLCDSVIPYPQTTCLTAFTCCYSYPGANGRQLCVCENRGSAECNTLVAGSNGATKRSTCPPP